jgi:hypothetical protein
MIKPEADRQLPVGDEIFLDHVGHFVRDAEAAGRALARAGFSPTPVSVQQDLDGTPTGTGNITAMFCRGYIEVLFKAADTALGRELDAAMTSHAGVHLAAFSVADVEKAHRRLTEAGFATRPLVQFQRPVDSADGPGIAAFTVVRLERGAMAEGRIQILAHRTENTVWQPRWLSHRNGALGLLDMVVACADPVEAAGRFARFTGRSAAATPFGRAVRLDRGQVQLMRADAFAAMFAEMPVPRLPFIGAYAVRVGSLSSLHQLLQQQELSFRQFGAALVVPFPADLGAGAWVFCERAAGLPWRIATETAMHRAGSVQ